MPLGPRPAFPLGASMVIVKRCHACNRPLAQFVVPHDEAACAATHGAPAWSGPVPSRKDGPTSLGSEEP